MKRYEFHDWDLVHGSPVKRTYGCIRRHRARWLIGLWRRITIEWDGREHLKATSWRLWPSTRSWSKQEVAGLSFGIREHIDRPVGSPPQHRGWFWYVHLNGRHFGGDPHERVLAEFMVGHQHERPATDAGRASVPPRVKDLVSWLETCTDRRAHGPVFVADKGARPRK
ncbi:MAG: hypothetical protein ACYC4U_28705 [Pirellulaceae bacterium]